MLGIILIDLCYLLRIHIDCYLFVVLFAYVLIATVPLVLVAMRILIVPFSFYNSVSVAIQNINITGTILNFLIMLSEGNYSNQTTPCKILNTMFENLKLNVN